MIGAGLAATPWLEALADLECDVVTVATRDSERFARVARLFPDVVQCWPPEDALVPADLDACVNLSPPSFHLDGVRLAADRRIPLLIEKPLELDLDRASRAVAIARQAGVPLAVCFQYRYREAARTLRALIDDGSIGPIRAATLEVPWWRDDDYYSQPGRGTYARDGGGVLMTQAIHGLDLLLWYLGEPRSVYAALSRGTFHDLEAEDLATGILHFPDALGTVFATTGARSAEETTLRLLGEKATAVLAGNELRVYDGDGDVDAVDVTDGQATTPASGPMDFPARWHRQLIAEALEAFDAGEPPPISGEDALASLALIDAMERSAEQGVPVEPGPQRAG